MNKEKVQQEAINILKVFQENIKNDIYISLQKAIKNDIIVSTYAKMDISGWQRVTGFAVAAESLYQYFKQYRYLFATKDEDEKGNDDSNQNVNGFKTVFITTLPVYKGSDKEHHRHSNKPLHLKTNWNVQKDHLMYQLEFRGHLYCNHEIIFAVAVGYIYNSEKALRRTNVKHICDGALISTYTSKDHHVVFKLVSKDNTNWHASDLTINMIGNGDWYHQAAWKKGLKIIDSYHADDNM